MPARQDGVENRDKVYWRLTEIPVSDITPCSHYTRITFPAATIKLSGMNSDDTDLKQVVHTRQTSVGRKGLVN